MATFADLFSEKELAGDLYDNIDTINRVASFYGLDEEQTRLLHSIRQAEQGKQGKEFGVLKPEAMRFANDEDPDKSFITQAMWAAGTIKKHYKGDVEKFGARWAPVGAENDPTGLNKNWVNNVKFYMKKFKGDK
jgi:hypothetical protein